MDHLSLATVLYPIIESSVIVTTFVSPFVLENSLSGCRYSAGQLKVINNYQFELGISDI